MVCRGAPPTRNIASLVGVLAVLFLPILILRRHLYEWMNIPLGHEASLDSNALTSAGASFWPDDFLLRVFYSRFVFLAPIVVRQDKDGNPYCTILMRKVAFTACHFSRVAHLRRVRLADEPELPLVLHHVWSLHLCRSRRQLQCRCWSWSSPPCAAPVI